MNPILSVIVPCYNVEKFVRECLSSIENQELREIEVICVNDGSTDGTLGIIKGFCKRDSRFKVIDKPNSGYGDSVNRGIDLAMGKYIGIIESDDYIEKDMFSSLVSMAESENLDIASGAYFYTYQDREVPAKIHRTPKGVVTSPMRDKSIFLEDPAIWSRIYLKSFILRNEIKFLPTPGASYQDLSFSFLCNLMCKRFKMVDKCYVHYRQHENNSVRSGGKVFAVSDELHGIVDYIKKHFGIREFSVGDVLYKKLTLSYKWNFYRLAGEERKRFLDRWSEDLREFAEWNIRPSVSDGLKDRLNYAILLSIPKLYGFLHCLR